MKAERVSYDVMTPSAARGILEAIHWKPAIQWLVDRIHVLNEIRFDSVRRNEVKGKIPATVVSQAMKGKEVDLHQYASDRDERQQRASLVLRDVAYVIEAHFELVESNPPPGTADKHYNMALRRMRSGQCFHRPYFGCREFPVNFRLLEDEPIPVSVHRGERDLGWMLLDFDYENGMTPKFFRAKLQDGIMTVPRLRTGGD